MTSENLHKIKRYFSYIINIVPNNYYINILYV